MKQICPKNHTIHFHDQLEIHFKMHFKIHFFFIWGWEWRGLEKSGNCTGKQKKNFVLIFRIFAGSYFTTKKNICGII